MTSERKEAICKLLESAHDLWVPSGGSIGEGSPMDVAHKMINAIGELLTALDEAEGKPLQWSPATRGEE